MSQAIISMMSHSLTKNHINIIKNYYLKTVKWINIMHIFITGVE